MAPKTICNLPQEVLILICQLLYLDGIPKTSFRTLDPHSLPSSYPDGRFTSSSPAQVQSTLYRLCLVNKAFYHATRPLLFRRIRITLPSSFLLLLRTLGASHLASAYEKFSLTGNVNLDPRDPTSFENMVAAAGFAHATGGKLVVSVPSSRTGSPYRERGRSKTREPRAGSSLRESTVMEDSSEPKPPARSSVELQRGQGSMKSKLVMDADGEVELVWQEEDLLTETESSTDSSDTEFDEDTEDTEIEDAAEKIVKPAMFRGRRKVQRFAVTLGHDANLSMVHRWVRILDFSTYSSQGMRRTIGEGQVARFVTPARLLALITACAEGLVAFGASETMDSALTREVLEALLFRSGSSTGERGMDDSDGRVGRPDHRGRGPNRQSRSLRGVSIERRRRDQDSESEDSEADRVITSASGMTRKRLQSLDFCNCVSPKFQEALSSFVEAHLKKFSGRVTDTLDEETSEEDRDDRDEERRGRDRGSRFEDRSSNTTSLSLTRSASRTRSLSRPRAGEASSSRLPANHPARATLFPSVLRLGLSGVTFAPEILNPFILAFSRLTHLDLSRTRIDADLLKALARQPADTLSLQSLSLAHCRHITSESIHELLVESPVTWNLTELSLECNLLFVSPLTPFDLTSIITNAPCFRSGHLRYLDLGGCPVTDENLLVHLPRQPSLLDLGLGSIEELSLEAVSQFLREKAPNVQIVELAESCSLRNGTQLAPGRGGLAISAYDISKHILGPCTETQPVPLTVQLALMGFTESAGGMTKEEAAQYQTPRPATNLRVIGLSDLSLKSVGDSISSWKVIRGRGRRGWLVDTRAGPDPMLKDNDVHGDVAGADGDGRGRRCAKHVTSMRRATSIGHNSLSPHRHAHFATEMSPSRSSSHNRVGGPSLGRNRPSALHRTEEGEEGAEKPLHPRAEVIRNLPVEHPRVQALRALAAANGHVAGDIGWHPKKMEVLLGFGMIGRETGTYAHVAYQI